MVHVFVFAFLAVPSATDRFVRGLFDDTFSGIHQLAWFDWALLIPYFVILGILSVYGLHRYEIIRTYFKYRKRATTEPPQRFEQLPPVTIQLPLYNERYVVERLIEEVTRVEYPRELLQIQVLDDSTDDTAPFAEALVERYRALGYPIEYHHRTHREGFKAGALQEGLGTATGELVAVFDADFVPPADFLTRTVHFFADPKVGVVQTRWSYLNRDYNFLTEVEAMLLDGHFVLDGLPRDALLVVMVTHDDFDREFLRVATTKEPQPDLEITPREDAKMARIHPPDFAVELGPPLPSIAGQVLAGGCHQHAFSLLNALQRGIQHGVGLAHAGRVAQKEFQAAMNGRCHTSIIRRGSLPHTSGATPGFGASIKDESLYN